MQISNFYNNSQLKKAFDVLEFRDRRKLMLIALTQILMGFLDLLGIIAIGSLGALSVQGIQSKPAGNKTSRVLEILNIQNLTFQQQVAILGLSAALILIVKTLASVIFTRKTFLFLSHKSAQISADLLSKVLSRNLIEVQKYSTQEFLYMISDGVKNLLLGIIATSISFVADFAMLIIIFSGLFIVDPVISFATIVLFLFIGLIMHKLLQVRARELGLKTSALVIESNEKILEVLNTYRESVVRNRRRYYADEIRVLRHGLADLAAEINFQPFISKYVIESTTIIGALALSAYEFSTKTSAQAIAILVVFIAASSRVAPAVLRIQQSLFMFKTSAGSADSTLRLLQELDEQIDQSDYDADPQFFYEDFTADVELLDVDFRYPGEKGFALENISLKIDSGTSAAIVGPSGAGKTTLLDLILGVLEPLSGEIKISGVCPISASQKWSGAISYVPQNIVISKGTIRENVGLGYKADVATDKLVWDSLDTAQLRGVVEKLPNTLDAQVGEHGAKISGGQRQRLGIARAMFTSPKLLVLDEATSSLDGQTESEITEAIESLSGKVTVIVVAHRLSTIRKVDKIFYIDNGRVIAEGKFDELRLKVKEFDKQAEIMGM